MERLLGRVRVGLPVSRPVGGPLGTRRQVGPRQRPPGDGHVLLGEAAVLSGAAFVLAHVVGFLTLKVSATRPGRITLPG